MFSKTKIVAIVAMSVSLLFFSIMFSSCSSQEEIGTVPEVELAISDPQIEAEIEFMKDTKIITLPLYNKWLTSRRSDVMDERDVVINESGDIRKDQFYRIMPVYSDSDMMYDEELFDRKIVKSRMEKSHTTEKVQLKRAVNMFASVGGTITCRVFRQTGNGRALVQQEWETALNQAVSVWNSLGLKVKFKVVDATSTNIVGGYVNVYMQDRQNVNVFASASSPNAPGYFGEVLIINSVVNTQADINGKKYSLIHELGHILGLKHTDEFANNSDIFNTAISCSDSWLGNSFMYGAMSYNKIFTDFSSCDKQNLQYYWGY